MRWCKLGGVFLWVFLWVFMGIVGTMGIMGILYLPSIPKYTQDELIKQKTDDLKSHLLNPIKASRDTGIRAAKPKSRYLIKKSARRSLSNKSL